MSCTCNVCYCKVRPPLSLWYVVTRHMWKYCYLCSGCLEKIPDGARTPVREQQDFEPTFGLVMAELSSRTANHQCSGSRMQQPGFSVPYEVLERTYPASNSLLAGLEYYARPDRLMVDLLQAQRLGTWTEWPTDAWPLDRLLTVLGPVIEGFLGFAPKGQPVRAHVTPPESLQLTAEQKNLAEELWQSILAWDAMGQPSPGSPNPKPS